MESQKKSKRTGKFLWKKLRNLLLHKKNYIPSEQSKEESIISKKFYENHNEYSFDLKLQVLISTKDEVKFDKDYFLSLANKKGKPF
jgi:hypothetical protein